MVKGLCGGLRFVKMFLVFQAVYMIRVVFLWFRVGVAVGFRFRIQGFGFMDKSIGCLNWVINRQAQGEEVDEFIIGNRNYIPGSGLVLVLDSEFSLSLLV